MKNTLDFRKQLQFIKQGQESFYQSALAQRNKFLEESKIASKCTDSLQELDLFKMYDLNYHGHFRIEGALGDDEYPHIGFVIMIRYDHKSCEGKFSFDLVLEDIDEDNNSEIIYEQNHKNFEEVILALRLKLILINR